MKKAFCPECQKEGKKSKVFRDTETRTGGKVLSYFDEEGYYHIHDPNTVIIKYSCTNNHYWAEEKCKPCWCGWGKE
jgi:hypothetical protein